jgi:hypothetical protein
MTGFNQMARTPVDPEKCCEVGDAARLSQVMSDYDYRVAAAQAGNKIFDHSGSDGIKCAAWLVHEQYFGVQRKRAGYTQPLLLATRQAQRGSMQSIANLSP